MNAIALLLALATQPVSGTELARCQMALQVCMTNEPIAFKIRPPDSDSPEYQEAERAAKRLKSAARDLATCAGELDFMEDCDREARDVRDAADDYERAARVYRQAR